MINGDTMAKTQEQYKYDDLISSMKDKERESSSNFNKFILNNIMSGKNQDKIGEYVSNKLTDLTTTLTAPPGTRTTNPYAGGALSNTGLSDILLDKARSSIRGLLSKENLAELAPTFLGTKGKNIQDQYKTTGKLSSAAELGRGQFLPDKVVDGKRIYEPITDKNRGEWFSDKEVGSIKDIILNRDAAPPIAKPKSTKYYPGIIKTQDFMTSKTDPDQENIKESLGKFEHGHYDEGGNWRAGVPDLKGNYTVRDTYNWNRDYSFGPGHLQQVIANTTQLGLNSLLDYLGLPSLKENVYPDTDMLEGLFQTFGPLQQRDEGRKMEFTVPTYSAEKDPMALMNVMASRLGPYRDVTRQGVGKYTVERVTPLGQGDLPGFGWQSEAFSTDEDTSLDTGTADPGQGGDFSTTEDQGYTSLDIGYRRGGQISQGLDNLYMNKRDSKQKLNNMMGFQERQYGGGLDDTYLNMSRRRSNAFADPNANTAFDSPMSIGGLPTVYREQGGNIPITSVYGQGIPRIIYRENGGDFGLYGDYTQADIDEAMASDPPEAEFGAGQYVPPQRGDPMIPFNSPPKGNYVNPPDTPFKSFNPNNLTYEAQQKVNRETQGRTPEEMDYRVGIPQLAYPSQAVIDDDILNMRLAAQNKIDEEKRKQANKPNQTPTQLFLNVIAGMGKQLNTDLKDKGNPEDNPGAVATSPESLYKAVDKENPDAGRNARNIVNAVLNGNYGKRAQTFARQNTPQALLDLADTAYKKSGGGLPTIYRADSGPTWGDYPDDAADAAFDAAMAGPTDDGLGGDFGGGGPPGGAPTAAPIYFSRPDPEDPFGEPRSITTPAPPPEEPIFDERISPGHPSIRAKAPIWEMSTDSETHLMSTLRDWKGNWEDAEQIFNNMTDQEKQNFEAAYHGKSFLGDINADDYTKGYRYGGARGTLQDILEQSIASDMDINDLILQKEYRDIHAKEFEKSQRELSGIELVGAGLMDFAKQITDLTSIQPDLKNDPYIMDQIMERAEAAGLNPQPVSSFGSKLLDYGITAAFGLPGTIAKGLHNLSGAGNTIMTVTKNGLEYNVSDTGKFSLNMPDADIDFGIDPPQTRQPRPVEKKKAAPKTEEKKAAAKKTTSSLPSIKESNIERLKTYMSLTGKDLSDSKQDLAITDISITEEDFT